MDLCYFTAEHPDSVPEADRVQRPKVSVQN